MPPKFLAIVPRDLVFLQPLRETTFQNQREEFTGLLYYQLQAKINFAPNQFYIHPQFSFCVCHLRKPYVYMYHSVSG